MKTVEPFTDGLTELRRIIAEWRELQATREARLTSGDERLVLRTLTAEYSLPHRAKRALIASLNEQQTRAQGELRQFEKNREELSEMRRPLQEQLDEIVGKIRPIDEKLLEVNAHIGRINYEIQAMTAMLHRLEKMDIKAVKDIQQLAAQIGIPIETE